MNLNELISKKLKGLRGENMLSLEEIANKLGIHRETYRKYENNPQAMDVGLFIELLNIYRYNPLIFFEQIYGMIDRKSVV